MSDRIQVLISVPVDTALPLDVQGVGLRRKAIDLMKEIATVDENTVRYGGVSDTASVNFLGDVGTISVWQQNLIVVRFIADGTAEKGVVGPVVHGDNVTRVYSTASVVRNEFSA